MKKSRKPRPDDYGEQGETFRKIDAAFDRIARPTLSGERKGIRANKRLATLARIRAMERSEETDW